jgi:hypothetical protein
VPLIDTFYLKSSHQNAFLDPYGPHGVVVYVDGTMRYSVPTDAAEILKDLQPAKIRTSTGGTNSVIQPAALTHSRSSSSTTDKLKVGIGAANLAIHVGTAAVTLGGCGKQFPVAVYFSHSDYCGLLVIC